MKFLLIIVPLRWMPYAADGRQLFWPDWLPVCWEPTL